jgi:uncharacterized protein
MRLVWRCKGYSRNPDPVTLCRGSFDDEDAGKVDLSRKGVHRKDKDFAVIWARNYGKGRVLYNGLGHREDVWERSDIQKMWLDMVRWSMGDLPGDATPRSVPAE